MTPIEFFFCIGLISFAAFLSAAEVALFSLSRFQLRGLRERFRSSHRKIKRLLADPGGLLITVLVSNEVANIGISTLITESVNAAWSPEDWPLFKSFPEWIVSTLFGVLITTPIVLFLCEATPKVIAARANQVVAPLAVGPLTWLYDAMKPARMILKWIVNIVSRIAGHEAQRVPIEGQQVLKEEDFLSMMEEGRKEGAIHEGELELIKNVFELDDTRVSDVFTPLTQVFLLPSNTTIKDAISSMRGNRYSRIPVTSGANRKQVLGVLYSKDLLSAKLEPEMLADPIAALIRKPLTVQPTTRLSSLFRKLKQHRTHLAIVEEEPGEALGVVTMADVLDALLEDVLDDEKEHAG